MAHGITYEDVATTAEKLQGEGKNPTADRIREALGTGSKTTINGHLKLWKAQQAELSTEIHPSLPKELLTHVVAYVGGVWTKLNETTDARIESLNEQNQKEIDFLKEAFIQLQSEKDTLEAQFKQETDKNQILRLENASLGSELRHEQQEHTKLRENYKTLQAQLSETKEEKNRFHTLATNLQETFHHYQESVQARQLEHDLKIGNVETQRDSLHKEVGEQKTWIHALQTEIDGKNQMLDKYQGLESKLEESIKEQAGLVREHTLLKAQYAQLGETHHTQTDTLQEKTNALIGLKEQLARITEQLSSLKKELQESERKTTALQQEKQILAEEKQELIQQWFKASKGSQDTR